MSRLKWPHPDPKQRQYVETRPPRINRLRVLENFGRPNLQRRIPGLPDAVYGFFNQFANGIASANPRRKLVSDEEAARGLLYLLDTNQNSALIRQHLRRVFSETYTDILWTHEILRKLGL
jgi:hypothetical protein